MIKNLDFQNWVFHYNPYEGIWFAIPRNLYVQFWNDRNTEGIIKSKDIKVLIEIIDSSEIESYK